jgi:decaprenylphospho-beta-D-ribofuranose 2-oxidase
MLSGWGRVPVRPGEEHCSEDLARVTDGAPLTRGLGRSYGDASLPAPDDRWLAGSRMADRILAFDPESGALRAEAGLSLEHIYRVFLPRGYFTPVSPGTRFVTLGGMVASDVHGKNHHREGTIGNHVRSLVIRVGSGAVVTCSRTEHPDLFRATLGGMGLTGHILEVTLMLARVPSPWIVEERERMEDLEQLISALKRAGTDWPMTAAWSDCLSPGLGRGILYRGRWAEPDEAPESFPHLGSPVKVPLRCPSVLAPGAVRIANALIYAGQTARVRRRVIHPQRFLYPLDALANWNRLYGTRGFVQYQCVLPREAGRAAIRRVLERLAGGGGTAFLCVLKDCGEQGEGVLSFPRPGMSIALDLPMRADTQMIVDALNEQVIDEGGRIYLAKDALTRPVHFRRMEPRIEEFLAIRRAWDPDGRIRSAQSVRLFGW